MASIRSLANPIMLKWARTTAHMDLHVAAKKAGVEGSRLESWEDNDNEELPTLAQLKTLSGIYKRPLAVFFLSEKPEDFDVIRDLRMTPNAGEDFSYKLIFEMRYAQQRQAWASEYRKDIGEDKCDFVGSVKLNDDVVRSGVKIRERLGVSIAEQNTWVEKYKALGGWISSVEALGVMVFQTSTVDVEEMRGFAIADDYAPVIMINSSDAPRARIFTVLHELVHIFLGHSGVSTIPVSIAKKKSNAAAEIFCNAVAGEILVPSRDFMRRLSAHSSHSTDEKLKILSRFYAVSREVIARRMYAVEEISRAEYNALRANFRKERKPVEETGDIRIPRARIVLRNNGKAFSKMAISAYREERIFGTDMSSLLNMKMNHFNNLEHELFPSRIT